MEMLPPNLIGLRVIVNDDNEVWLHFTPHNAAGAASINLTALAERTSRESGSVISDKLLAWCNERVDQARQMQALKL